MQYHKNHGNKRVFGIRDFENQLVYWSEPNTDDLPDAGQSLIYPNKILVYNYIEQSFSYFNDSFTCFGYYWIQPPDLTWGNADMTWAEADFPWGAYEEQAQFQSVVGGNQQGFVEILMQDTFNEDSLFISQITPATPLTTIVSPNHNLLVGDFVKIISNSCQVWLIIGPQFHVWIPEQPRGITP